MLVGVRAITPFSWNSNWLTGPSPETNEVYAYFELKVSSLCYQKLQDPNKRSIGFIMARQCTLFVQSFTLSINVRT